MEFAQWGTGTSKPAIETGTFGKCGPQCERQEQTIGCQPMSGGKF